MVEGDRNNDIVVDVSIPFKGISAS